MFSRTSALFPSYNDLLVEKAAFLYTFPAFHVVNTPPRSDPLLRYHEIPT